MESHQPTKFWKLWKEDLKVSFPKKSLTDALVQRWQKAHPNVLARLKKEKFVDFTSDIQFMYENYGLGYTMERGFFFDEEKYKKAVEIGLINKAKKMGMSK